MTGFIVSSIVGRGASSGLLGIIKSSGASVAFSVIGISGRSISLNLKSSFSKKTGLRKSGMFVSKLRLSGMMNISLQSSS